MIPRCAACGNPLVVGQHMVLGAEVVHKQCVVRAAEQGTESTRMADALARAERRCAELERSQRAARGGLDDQARALNDAQQARAVAVAAAGLASARAEQLAAQLAAATAELAALKASRAESTDDTRSTEPVDATVARFSLLELD